MADARFERVVEALGALARPYVLYSAALSAAVVTIRLGWTDAALIEKAAFVGTVWSGVAVLFGAKALEERGKAKSDERVAIARATGLDGSVKGE